MYLSKRLNRSSTTGVCTTIGVASKIEQQLMVWVFISFTSDQNMPMYYPSFLPMDGLVPSLNFFTAFGGKAEDDFHVVGVPSIPGYGFSDKPIEAEWNTARIARAWVILLQRLGYQKWVAPSGDWGADVATILGFIRPIGLIGIHLNFQYVFPDDQSDNFSSDK
ncbi:unnamed protein product [Adineta ricciae]|uniref:Uncharacterized protein n=1 Tax=Adineta ricciae TaxID=249248 RepID=A0A815F6E7_ADIRI|nr:unnamed protein product [Adineta ricciae]CAF1320865.1 unnamed protein product [Adineta ricciae]